MRFLDQFYICKKNIIGRKKSSLSYVILTFVLSLVILIVLTLTNTICDYISKNIDNNIEYRTVFVKYDVIDESLNSVINKVKKINHVSVVLEKDEYDTYVKINEFKSSKTDGEVNLVATTPDMSPPIIYGRNINENENNILICPINFIADSNASERSDLYKEDYVDIKKYLNKYIDIRYYTYDYSHEIPQKIKENVSKYQLIGLYDSSDSYSNNNVCYASTSDILKINRISNGNMEEYVQGVYWYPIAIIDNSRNVQSVVDKINDLGYTSVQKLEINTELIDNIKTASLIISILISFLSFFCIRIFVSKLLKDIKSDIGILKAIGYTNNYIFMIVLLEIIILSSIGILISFLLYTILYSTGMYITNNSSIMWTKFDLEYSVYGIIAVIAIFLLTSFICCSTMKKKINKISIINVMNDL